MTRAIEEERAKRPAGGAAPISEPEIPNRSESSSRRDAGDGERVKELELQNRDLEITTRAKDYYLERLKKERGQLVEKLIVMSRYVGELETQMLALGGAPRGYNSLPHGAEAVGKAVPHRKSKP